MTARNSLGLAVQVALIAAVSTMEVFTSKELQAKNGTDTRLKCTFSSTEQLGDEVTVSWTFRPLSGGKSESVPSFSLDKIAQHAVLFCSGNHDKSHDGDPTEPIKVNELHEVFYFHREPYPPTDGRFQNRAVWDGNTKRSDASIVIRNIQQTDNGTYLCQVKNPPDSHGEMGEIMLSVVDQVKFSEIMLLVLIIGVGSVVIIPIVITVVLCRYYRKQRTHSTAVSVMECREKLNDDKSRDLNVNA